MGKSQIRLGCIGYLQQKNLQILAVLTELAVVEQGHMER